VPAHGRNPLVPRKKKRKKKGEKAFSGSCKKSEKLVPVGLIENPEEGRKFAGSGKTFVSAERKS